MNDFPALCYVETCTKSSSPQLIAGSRAAVAFVMKNQGEVLLDNVNFLLEGCFLGPYIQDTLRVPAFLEQALRGEVWVDPPTVEFHPAPTDENLNPEPLKKITIEDLQLVPGISFRGPVRNTRRSAWL